MIATPATSQGRSSIARVAAIALALLGALTIAAAVAPGAGAAVAGPLAVAQAASGVPRAAAIGSIIVVRRAAAQDSLWRVSPAGVGVKLADLPFRPARMVGSPDASKIAILPSPGRARIYVYDIAGAKLAARSFATLGVRSIDGLTWLSSTKILVSASTTAKETKYPLTDRLYTIKTTGGEPVAFRHLRGTEPSATPGADRLLYVRIRDAGLDPADAQARLVVEDLMSLKLAPGSKAEVLKHARYSDSYDIRRFRDPDVSADGKYVVSSTTGSDVSVTYAVRRVATGKLVRAKRTSLGPRDRTAWNHGSGRVAFWGMPPAGNMQTAALYVFDVASAKIMSDGPFSKVAVSGLAWAPDDSLLAYSMRSRSGAVDNGRLWTIDPGTAATPTDLGPGSLPVWVP